MTDAEMPVRRVYDLNGVTLAIAAAEEGPAAFLDLLMRPLAAPPRDAHDWTIALEPAAAIEKPDRGRLIFDETLPEGLPVTMVEDAEGRRLVVPGHLEMAFRRAARRTAIRYVPGHERTLGGTVAFWLLGDLLAAHHRQLLHGASLVDPRHGTAIAIFAPSGTGKSTTTLALARAGFPVTGDDVMVLDAAAPGGPSLWGIPRTFKVHRKTAAMLPWLAPVLTETWNAEDEQAIPYRLLRALIPVAAPVARPLSAVIVLKQPNPEGHAILPISRPDALAAIAGDNVRVAPGGVDADNAAMLAAAARLISAVPVVALSVGPDPSSLAPALLAGLR